MKIHIHTSGTYFESRTSAIRETVKNEFPTSVLHLKSENSANLDYVLEHVPVP